MTTGHGAVFAGAAILTLCTACSSGSSYPCGDLPQPGVTAKFDAYSIASARDRVTAIEICATYQCRNYDFNGVYNYLWIPFHYGTFVIKNLTVTVLAGSRVIRTAHAPGDLMIPTSGRATDACARCDRPFQDRPGHGEGWAPARCNESSAMMRAKPAAGKRLSDQDACK